MNPATVEHLEMWFAEWPEAQAGPVHIERIEEAERLLGVVLPQDYKEFLGRYGGAAIGSHVILGLKEAPLSPSSGLVEKTLRMRSQLPHEFQNMLVMEIDGYGNPIGFDPPGPQVIIYDHDRGARETLAESFEEYLQVYVLPQV